MSIHAIGGMAGIGKTALAVHAAHQLGPRFPDGQIFLSPHGHTPGQRPVEPADALASLLLTAGVCSPQFFVLRGPDITNLEMVPVTYQARLARGPVNVTETQSDSS